MRAIFLNRDGVINQPRTDHVKPLDEFRFLPGVFAALRWLRLSGMHVFVVANQASAERGIAPAQLAQKVHARMTAQVTLHGGVIHDFRHCPHDLGDQCSCYKPQPKLLLDLAAQWKIDLSRSYMIANSGRDLAAGRAVGCCCVFVAGGSVAAPAAPAEAALADYVAADLPAAVEWLLHQEWVMSHDHQLAARPQPLIANVVGGLSVSG